MASQAPEPSARQRASREALVGLPDELAERPVQEVMAWVSWRGLVPDPELFSARDLLALL